MTVFDDKSAAYFVLLRRNRASSGYKMLFFCSYVSIMRPRSMAYGAFYKNQSISELTRKNTEGEVMSKRLIKLLFTTVYLSALLPAPPAAIAAEKTSPQCMVSSPAQIAHHLLKKLVDDTNLPGLSAAIGLKGDIIWETGIGFADLEQQVPATPRTRYRIGSISKPIAASAIGVLLERGQIDLDASVQKYVPTFPTKRWPVSTRQLAGHVAGIRNYRDQEFLSNRHFDNVTDAITVFQDDPLVFEPGSKFAYTTYGWTLVSAAIENAAQVDFRHFVQTEVLNRLNMRETIAEDNRQIISNRSRYYDRANAGNEELHLVNSYYVDNSNKWAGGGYLSTMRDLVHFGGAHLNDSFLRFETIATLTTPMHLTNGDETGFGIGWEREVDLHGRKTLGHTGGAVGGTSVLRMWPDQELVVAASTNVSQDPGIRLLGNALGEIFSPASKVVSPYIKLMDGVYRFAVSGPASASKFSGYLLLRTGCLGYEGELYDNDGTRLGSIAWGRDESESSHLFMTTKNGLAQVFITTNSPSPEQKNSVSGSWTSQDGRRELVAKYLGPISSVKK